MILLGKHVADKKIVHVDNDEEKSEVKDILISKEKPEIAFLTYEIKMPIGEIGEAEDGTGEGPVSAIGGTDPGVRPGSAPPEAVPPNTEKKQYFLIPKDQIDRITTNAVVMKGTEVQGESGEEEYYSYLSLKGREIESEDGEKLGKIKDIVIEEIEKKIIGLKLSEGFWEKLIGDGTKYMPYEGFVEWNYDKIVVKTSIKDQLVDEYEQLL
ncbi:MAG TPA: PRC-barrel domain-containing protein [Bacillales bacterium]